MRILATPDMVAVVYTMWIRPSGFEASSLPEAEAAWVVAAGFFHPPRDFDVLSANEPVSFVCFLVSLLDSTSYGCCLSLRRFIFLRLTSFCRRIAAFFFLFCHAGSAYYCYYQTHLSWLTNARHFPRTFLFFVCEYRLPSAPNIFRCLPDPVIFRVSERWRFLFVLFSARVYFSFVTFQSFLSFLLILIYRLFPATSRNGDSDGSKRACTGQDGVATAAPRELACRFLPPTTIKLVREAKFERTGFSNSGPIRIKYRRSKKDNKTILVGRDYGGTGSECIFGSGSSRRACCSSYIFLCTIAV